jgi:hypothetical protein
LWDKKKQYVKFTINGKLLSKHKVERSKDLDLIPTVCYCISDEYKFKINLGDDLETKPFVYEKANEFGKDE